MRNHGYNYPDDVVSGECKPPDDSGYDRCSDCGRTVHRDECEYDDDGNPMCFECFLVECEKRVLNDKKM